MSSTPIVPTMSSTPIVPTMSSTPIVSKSTQTVYGNFWRTLQIKFEISTSDFVDSAFEANREELYNIIIEELDRIDTDATTRVDTTNLTLCVYEPEQFWPYFNQISHVLSFGDNTLLDLQVDYDNNIVTATFGIHPCA
jgi:hypothetical protein